MQCNVSSGCLAELRRLILVLGVRHKEQSGTSGASRVSRRLCLTPFSTNHFS